MCPKRCLVGRRVPAVCRLWFFLVVVVLLCPDKGKLTRSRDVRVLLMALANQDVSCLSTKHAKVMLTITALLCTERRQALPPAHTLLCTPPLPPHVPSASSQPTRTWTPCLGPCLAQTSRSWSTSWSRRSRRSSLLVLLRSARRTVSVAVAQCAHVLGPPPLLL